MFASIFRQVRKFVRDESGPTAVEYAVMLALIIVVCLISIRLVGTNTNRTFQTTVNAMNTVTP